jgi:putative intracellular protease/amidase
VITPDGQPPYADPYGLSWFFHYPDEDKDYLASVVRTFARDVDDIRLTLHQNTGLGLAAARRVAALLERQGRTAAQAQRADSQKLSDERAARLRALPGFQHPVALSALTDAELGEFDAVFAPGGHGPMVDLADNPDVGRLLAALQARRAPIAALYHGPAMLLAAPERADGLWLFDGYRARLLGLAWLLDVALKNAGAVFDDGPAAWVSHVVVDRNLITGQNPESTEATADAVVLRSVLADLVRAFPDLMISVSRIITTGDVVTALFKAEGTQADSYAGAINQEKHLDIDQAWRFVVDAGLITKVDAYWCQAQLYRRLAVKRYDEIAIA